MTIRPLWACLAIAAGAAGLAACSDGTPEEPLIPSALERVGGHAQTDTVAATLPDSLEVRVLDAGGAPLADVAVEWTATAGQLSSSRTETGADGRTAVAWTLGTVAGADTATASVGELEAVFAAEALPGDLAQLTLSDSSLVFRTVDDTTRLTATARDAYGNARAGVVVDWTAADTAVATVQDGLVTSRGTGATEITAAADTITATASVTVDQPVATFALTGPSSVTAGAPTTYDLTAEDSAGNGYDGVMQVTFTGAGLAPDSTAPTVADTGGAAVAFGTAAAVELVAGQAAVPITLYAADTAALSAIGADSATTDTVEVVVSAGPTDTVAVSPARATVFLTTTFTFHASPEDAWGNPKPGPVTWTSSTGGAPVDTSGTVTGQSTGVATITAEASSGATGQATASVESFTQISAGPLHVCGVTGAGAAYCWGDDNDGRLGDGVDSDMSSVPSRVADPSTGPVTWSRVRVGTFHACGLTTAGGAYCWGRGTASLGTGSNTYSSDVPLPVADPASGPVTWSQLTAGRHFTCGVTVAGDGYCWGYDGDGRLGNGDSITDNQNAPVPIADPAAGPVAWSDIRAGKAHACGVASDSTGYCWGIDEHGQLGDGPDTTASSIPSPVADPSGGPVTWATISPAVHHTCGRTTDGDAYCWGDDAAGQLGDGATTSDSAVPVLVVDPTGGTGAWAMVRAGGVFSCGITGAADAYCWGKDFSGQLGNGPPTENSGEPVPVSDPGADPVGWTHIAQGTARACGVTDAGVAFCWGYDAAGALGNGDSLTEDQTTPSKVVSQP